MSLHFGLEQTHAFRALKLPLTLNLFPQITHFTVKHTGPSVLHLQAEFCSVETEGEFVELEHGCCFTGETELPKTLRILDARLLLAAESLARSESERNPILGIGFLKSNERRNIHTHMTAFGREQF